MISEGVRTLDATGAGFSATGLDSDLVFYSVGFGFDASFSFSACF
jgi:hypothetical protein